MTHEDLLEKGYRLYPGDKVDVYFNLSICEHSGVCTRTLPAVFNVKRKPWILADEAPHLRVAQMIRTCPSGALQFILKEDEGEPIIEYQERKVVAYINDEEMGEVTYSPASDTMLIIDHTFVDDKARGKQVGQKLIKAVVDLARFEGKTIIPLCPFAAAEFKKRSEYADVLKK